MRARDLILARRARKYGARWSLRIITEARAAGIPVSLGFALVEQESEFRNVFGHDPTIFVGAGPVTKSKYAAYKRLRGRSMMQGVGPCQLTWWATQDQADAIGGCWVPKCNIRVAFRTLALNIASAPSQRLGIRAYNGSGPRADAYAALVKDKADRWHARLS